MSSAGAQKAPEALFLVGDGGPAGKALKKKGGWQWPLVPRCGEAGLAVGAGTAGAGVRRLGGHLDLHFNSRVPQAGV